jgi:uracil phosphoribosyltransferase
VAVPVHRGEHTLAQDALAVLRDARTPTDQFRRAAIRISRLLAAEALRDLPTTESSVETPLGVRAAVRQVTRDVVVIPVLRAGLAMLDPVLELVPNARVGHIGLQRDELTAAASLYYCKIPGGVSSSSVIIIDPMLATGGSMVAALDLLRQSGACDVRVICIVAAPEGVALVERQHPDVTIYTPAVDAGLDSRSYIIPGLGDFGDRLYGTAEGANSGCKHVAIQQLARD